MVVCSRMGMGGLITSPRESINALRDLRLGAAPSPSLAHELFAAGPQDYSVASHVGFGALL